MMELTESLVQQSFAPNGQSGANEHLNLLKRSWRATAWKTWNQARQGAFSVTESCTKIQLITIGGLWFFQAVKTSLRSHSLWWLAEYIWQPVIDKCNENNDVDRKNNNKKPIWRSFFAIATRRMAFPWSEPIKKRTNFLSQFLPSNRQENPKETDWTFRDSQRLSCRHILVGVLPIAADNNTAVRFFDVAPRTKEKLATARSDYPDWEMLIVRLIRLIGSEGRRICENPTVTRRRLKELKFGLFEKAETRPAFCLLDGIAMPRRVLAISCENEAARCL